MSKTPQERYDEIRKEIIQISESYVLITRNKLTSDLNTDEIRHMGMLYFELRKLVKELKTMFLHDIEISLIYRQMVNELMYHIKIRTDAEFMKEIRKDKIGEIYL